MSDEIPDFEALVNEDDGRVEERSSRDDPLFFDRCIVLLLDVAFFVLLLLLLVPGFLGIVEFFFDFSVGSCE